MKSDLCSAFWKSIPHPKPKIIYRQPEEADVLAKYESETDTIIMYISQEDGYSFFYHTLFHDLTHREIYFWMKEQDLSVEDMLMGEREPFDEILAEVGASIMCLRNGIYRETKVDHLDYIDYHKIRLKDKRLLFEVFPTVSSALGRILGKTVSRRVLPIEVRLALLKVR
jgi:antirestriction protein ArdC